VSLSAGSIFRVALHRVNSVAPPAPVTPRLSVSAAVTASGMSRFLDIVHSALIKLLPHHW
jgi:hypothetical protein